MTPNASTTVNSSADPFAVHWSLYPRHYVATKAPEPLVIDGNIFKKEWDLAEWTAAFDEIRGAEDAPADARPPPGCSTRVKMMWDESFLYICALIVQDFTVVADFTHRNDPIFQKDSDFEVFLNPSGSCHDYKELEVNPINTAWNLMLDKPYDDGGSEHSGRIAKPGEKSYFEVKNQKTAAQIIKGEIGDPNGATWVVELALAHSDTLSFDPRGKGLSPPKIGDKWRINFSRVERKGDTNWTWQAQRIWDPKLGRVAGKVAMHLPDAWGYVEFGPTEKEKDTAIHRDHTWPERLAAMNIYYAQQRHAELHDGHYAASLGELNGLVDDAILKPFVLPGSGITIRLTEVGTGFIASVIGPTGTYASVTNDRLLTVDLDGTDSDVAKSS